MGTCITNMFSASGNVLPDDLPSKKTVFHLANYALKQVINKQINYGTLLAATSCPDSIAPSLGQCIIQEYSCILSNVDSIDIVQGCTAGVSTLILASQLSEHNKSHVLLITADAAQKATSPASEVYKVFKDGVFACCVSYVDDDRKLIHHQTTHYKDLHNVVTIKLGHDADEIIAANIQDIASDSRKYLGLQLDNAMAIKLMKQAEGFYLDFISKTGHPDVLILHQVNELIIDHLEKVFAKYPVRFINQAKATGNCGCATTGIVLDTLQEEIKNKKVMVCSFGTGGAITAGLWQF